MFNINDMASLRAAYSFVRTLREFTVPVENVVRRDTHSHIVRDDGIDGYVELVQLPEDLDEVHKVVAADWFRANCYLESLPTPYDCSGQKFTNWFKLFRRQGHWFAYHSVSIDV